MADNREVSESVAMDLLLSGHSSGLYFCRPGIIEEFDPAANLAVVRPAIQAKVTPREGQPQYITFPTIIRVPVVIPYAQKAGLCITVPIRKGDECLLLFSDRMIDNFVKTGGIVKPECCGGDNKTSEPRQHDLTDAICIPGIISQPFKVKNWNTEAIEMRTVDGKNYVRVGEGDYGIRMTSGGGFDQGGADIRMKDGKIWWYAAEEINTRTPMKWTEEPPTSSGGTRGPTMPE